MAEPLLDNAWHLLVVDDDLRLRELLNRYLMKEGFRVTLAEDAEDARKKLTSITFDLMVLDVMMPGQSGLELMQSLKEQRLDIPVLMLTAKADPEDRITGLEAGVHDYLTKPFEPKELLLRILNILRYTHQDENEDQIICFGPYSFDISKKVLNKGDERVSLSDTEIKLIDQLAKSSGQAVTRQSLSADPANVSDRSIDVQMTRLRQKLEDNPSEPEYLLTVRGQGYRLVVD